MNKEETSWWTNKLLTDIPEHLATAQEHLKLFGAYRSENMRAYLHSFIKDAPYLLEQVKHGNLAEAIHAIGRMDMYVATYPDMERLRAMVAVERDRARALRAEPKRRRLKARRKK